MDLAALVARDPVVTALGTFAVAIVAGISGYFAARAGKAADIQSAITAAMKDLLEQYRTALRESEVEKADLHQRLTDLTDEVTDLRRLVGEQSEEIGGLNAHIEALTAALIAAGMNPPPRRRRAQKPVVVGVEGCEA